MNNPYLEKLIADFNADRIIRFFNDKSKKFVSKKEDLDEYNDDFFKEGVKLGEINFDESEKLIVCAFLCENPLSERSGKKIQYEKAKKILKERISDAGIFVFFDKDGSFRFSLIYANYLGQQQDWSTFKRFTYFVSKEFTNKTFLKRIGECDFTSIEKIKDAFSVEKVTKEFYENISFWYFWAVKNCTFPKGAEAEENGRNISVIRLITRMIFVWFMRERGLIRKELFDLDSINSLLIDTTENSSSYYQAILQNLFFATLSTKQEEREFRSEVRRNKGFNSDHGNQYVYRFQSYFTDFEKLRTLFKDIPFLNGGLFDCLDDSQKGIYIDGFSETKKNQVFVPNFLFFGKEVKVDLSDDLGPQHKAIAVKGLLNILSEFNFTIDENTTDDKDVALDPELLGRVFENLLASFNPETSSTARKATGSYYTPREIVDYMVDESLKGYLHIHLTNVEKIDENLSLLFSQDTEENPFTQEESKQIVSLIESVRVVDPAVGSGAFLMGILNRLVFLLHKVDPNNDFWKQEQLTVAEQIPDSRIQKETKDRIETYFAKNDNYGRKLFLIQKCIYGVDIQQIAVEIAKLRFFISLLVDEEIDKEKANWGIEPLPNLDFKIMQGNSLISEFLGVNLETKQESSIGQTSFDFQDERLRLIKQFERKKIEYQNEPDKTKKGKLLQEIDDAIIGLFDLIMKQQKEDHSNVEELIKRKYSVLPNKDDAEKLIRNEKEKINTRSSFNFENVEKQLREYTGKLKVRPFFPWQLYFAEIFIEKKGFDIILTNPPYIGEKGHKEVFHEVKLSSLGKYYLGKMDYFYFFFHLALDIGNLNAQAAFITTNYYITASGAKKLREDLKNRSSIMQLINFNVLKIFESALGQNNMITIFRKGYYEKIKALTCITSQTGVISPEILALIISQNDSKTEYWAINSQSELYEGEECYIRLNGNINSAKNIISNILLKIKSVGIPLGEICSVDAGLHPGVDKISEKISKKYSEHNFRINEGVFVLTSNEAEVFKDKEYLKPLYKSSDIPRWSPTQNSYYILYSSPHKEIVDEKFISHISKYRRILEDVRLKNNENIRNWKYLRRGVLNEKIYSNIPKIITPYRSNISRFAYTVNPFYASQDVYFITDKKQGYSLKYILALLNSSLYFLWLYYRGKRKGEALELYQTPLSEIPIKVISDFEQKPFIEIVDHILALTDSSDYFKNKEKCILVKKFEMQIDNMVYELFGLTDEEIAVVKKSMNDGQAITYDKKEDFFETTAGK